jgi:hypothetical protein
MRMDRMLAGDVAVASGDVATTLVNAQYEGITNFPIVAAFLSFFVAQSLKVLTTWYFRLQNLVFSSRRFLQRTCMPHIFFPPASF